MAANQQEGTMANNNPAMTAPATQELDSNPNKNNQTTVDKDSLRRDQKKKKKSQHANPSKNITGWRRLIRNFSPSWFSTTMGTGIVSTLLITLPFHPLPSWLYYLSITFFLLNVCLFSLAFSASVLRYTLWNGEIWGVMIKDTTNSLFLGTMPMGFATIVEMWVFVCVPAWGEWAVWVGWGMWVLDCLVAVGVTVGLGILLMSAPNSRTLDTVTAAQLLPIAATIVAAGTGSEVASTLTSYPQYALGTLLASYIMWGMATPFALSVLVIYYQRLALHKMPSREIIVSAFLPLGPLGFGGYTILYLGKVAKIVFPLTDTLDPLAGQIAYVLGFFVALILWSWGLIWFAFALASIYMARPFPFNMGWWGFTFPLGVYSASTILIGEELPSKLFGVLGTVFAAAVVGLWVVIAVGTAKGAWSGELFHAPCLANLKGRESIPERSGAEEEKGVAGSSEIEARQDDGDLAALQQLNSREAPDIDR